LVPDLQPDQARLEAMPDVALAMHINTRLPKIESAVTQAREHASNALNAAVEIGHYLNEARRRAGKGHWLDWLEKNCPDLSQPTAYRYMGLARKLSHVINGKNGMTIRQAYLACGILPDEPTVKKEPPDLDHAPEFGATEVLAQVRSLRQYVSGIQGLPFDTMDAPFLEQLSEEMSALIEVCDEVKTKAAGGRTIKAAKAVEVSPRGDTAGKAAKKAKRK